MFNKQRFTKVAVTLSGLIGRGQQVVRAIRSYRTSHIVLYHQLSTNEACDIVKTYRRCYAIALNEKHVPTTKQSILCLDLALLMSQGIDVETLSRFNAVETVVLTQVDRIYRLPEIIEVIKRNHQQSVLRFNPNEDKPANFSMIEKIIHQQALSDVDELYLARLLLNLSEHWQQLREVLPKLKAIVFRYSEASTPVCLDLVNGPVVNECPLAFQGDNNIHLNSPWHLPGMTLKQGKLTRALWCLTVVFSYFLYQQTALVLGLNNDDYQQLLAINGKQQLMSLPVDKRDFVSTVLPRLKNLKSYQQLLKQRLQDCCLSPLYQYKGSASSPIVKRIDELRVKKAWHVADEERIGNDIIAMQLNFHPLIRHVEGRPTLTVTEKRELTHLLARHGKSYYFYRLNQLLHFNPRYLLTGGLSHWLVDTQGLPTSLSQSVAMHFLPIYIRQYVKEYQTSIQLTDSKKAQRLFSNWAKDFYGQAIERLTVYVNGIKVQSVSSGDVTHVVDELIDAMNTVQKQIGFALLKKVQHSYPEHKEKADNLLDALTLDVFQQAKLQALYRPILQWLVISTAASRKELVSETLQGRETRLSNIEKKLNRLPLLKQHLWSLPLQAIWQSLLAERQVMIEHRWQQLISEQVVKILKSQFPFSPKAKQNASLKQAKQVLAYPEGTLWHFYDAKLKPYFSYQQGKLVAKQWLGRGILISPQANTQLQSLLYLAKTHFASGHKAYPVSVLFKPAVAVKETILTMGEQQISYQNGLESWQNIYWQRDKDCVLKRLTQDNGLQVEHYRAPWCLPALAYDQPKQLRVKENGKNHLLADFRAHQWFFPTTLSR